MRDFVPAPTHSSALVTPAAIDSLANANPPSDPPDSFRPPDTTALNPDATIMNGVLETKLGRGVAYGYVSSLADGATLQAGVREYYLELVEKINAIWWERAGMLSEAPRQDGTVEIVVLRDGTLAARRMIRGTGSREVDRALIESIDRAAPFSRLPADFLPNVFFAPIKITAPSRLLRIMRQ
ncbi:MAG: TonB C-terminal domain-containing protein [Desulfuromonadales bacterium]